MEQNRTSRGRGAFRPAYWLLLLILAGFLLAAYLHRGEILALAQGRGRRAAAVGSISGTVTGAGGTPVAGARVLAQTSDGRAPRATTTDADGRFHFRGLRVAPYDLRVHANQTWSEWTRNVPVRANAESTVKLSIPSNGASPDKPVKPKSPAAKIPPADNKETSGRPHAPSE